MTKNKGIPWRLLIFLVGIWCNLRLQGLDKDTGNFQYIAFYYNVNLTCCLDSLILKTQSSCDSIKVRSSLFFESPSIIYWRESMQSLL